MASPVSSNQLLSSTSSNHGKSLTVSTPGPPLYFTPEQLALLPQQEEDNSSKLMDHNDLFVLDMAPSLKTLTIVTIIQNNLSTEANYIQHI